jgi:hypothetical protein
MQSIPSADETARILKIVTVATIDGKANTPDEKETTFGAMESRIEEYWSHYYDEAKNETNNHIQELLKTKNETNGTYESALASESEDITGEVDSIVTNFENDAASSYDVLRGRRIEYDEFRKSADLSRTHNERKPFAFYLTVLIFVVESGINASMFKSFLSGGLISGVMIAGSVALINVGYSYIVGRYFITQWHLDSLLRKFIAAIMFVSWLLIILLVNFGAGLFRQITESTATNSKNMDLSQIFNEMAVAFNPSEWPPFAVNSVLLMMVGGFFAVISLIDGYLVQDPFPGFARVGKNLDDAERDLSSLIDEVREDVEYKRLEAFNFDKEQERIVREESVNLQNLIIEIKSTHDQFMTRVEEVSNRIKSNISTYRNINKKSREKSVAPKYFDDLNISANATSHIHKITFSDMLGSNMTGDLELSLDDLKLQLTDQINSALDKKRSRLGEVFEKAKMKITKIEKIGIEKKQL